MFTFIKFSSSVGLLRNTTFVKMQGKRENDVWQAKVTWLKWNVFINSCFLDRLRLISALKEDYWYTRGLQNEENDTKAQPKPPKQQFDDEKLASNSEEIGKSAYLVKPSESLGIIIGYSKVKRLIAKYLWWYQLCHYHWSPTIKFLQFPLLTIKLLGLILSRNAIIARLVIGSYGIPLVNTTCNDII